MSWNHWLGDTCWCGTLCFHWFFDALDRFWRAANWVPNLYDICMLYCMGWRSPCFWRARHEIKGNRYQMFNDFNAYRLSTSHVVEGSAARDFVRVQDRSTHHWQYAFWDENRRHWNMNSVTLHPCLNLTLKSCSCLPICHACPCIANPLLFCITSMHMLHPVLCSPKFLYMLLRIFCWAPFKYLDGWAVQHVTLLPWMSVGGEDSSKDATEIRLKHNIMHRECKRWWRNKSIAM